jgi:hypothetical protein
MNLHYFLVSQDELRKTLRSGNIFIPYEPRYISSYHPDNKNHLNEGGVNNLKKKLLDLSIDSSQDFTLALVEIYDFTTLAYKFEITIFSLKKIFCLDDLSLKFFKRTFPQFNLSIISSSPSIDIEKIVENSNRNRIKKILDEEFGIKFNENLENKIKSLEKENHIKVIFDFKREINIKNTISSYMNDLITVGIISKGDKFSEELYKGGKDISEKFFMQLYDDHPDLKEFDETDDFIGFIKTLLKKTGDEKEDKKSTLTRLNNSFTESPVRNELLIKIIYLRLKNIFQDSKQDTEFENIFDIYSSLMSMYPEETQISYILFFKKLNYSDIYTSYYNYKKPPSFCELIETKSPEQEEIEKLKSQIEIKDRQLDEKNKKMQKYKKGIDSNKNSLLETDVHKSDGIPTEEIIKNFRKELIEKILKNLSIDFNSKHRLKDLKSLLCSKAPKVHITISDDNNILKLTSPESSVASTTLVAGSQAATETTDDDNHAEISSSSSANSSSDTTLISKRPK